MAGRAQPQRREGRGFGDAPPTCSGRRREGELDHVVAPCEASGHVAPGPQGLVAGVLRKHFGLIHRVGRGLNLVRQLVDEFGILRISLGPWPVALVHRPYLRGGQ